MFKDRKKKRFLQVLAITTIPVVKLVGYCHWIEKPGEIVLIPFYKNVLHTHQFISLIKVPSCFMDFIQKFFFLWTSKK